MTEDQEKTQDRTGAQAASVCVPTSLGCAVEMMRWFDVMLLEGAHPLAAAFTDRSQMPKLLDDLFGNAQAFLGAMRIWSFAAERSSVESTLLQRAYDHHKKPFAAVAKDGSVTPMRPDSHVMLFPFRLREEACAIADAFELPSVSVDMQRCCRMQALLMMGAVSLLSEMVDTPLARMHEGLRGDNDLVIELHGMMGTVLLGALAFLDGKTASWVTDDEGFRYARDVADILHEHIMVIGESTTLRRSPVVGKRGSDVRN